MFLEWLFFCPDTWRDNWDILLEHVFTYSNDNENTIATGQSCYEWNTQSCSRAIVQFKCLLLMTLVYHVEQYCLFTLQIALLLMWQRLQHSYLIVHGSPGNSFNWTFKRSQISFSLNTALSRCPPQFYLHTNTKSSQYYKLLQILMLLRAM